MDPIAQSFKRPILQIQYDTPFYGVSSFVKPQNGSAFHHGYPQPFIKTHSRFINPSYLQAIGNIAQTNALASTAVQFYQARMTCFALSTVFSRDKI